MFQAEPFYINRKGYITPPAVWEGGGFADGGKVSSTSLNRGLSIFRDTKELDHE